MNIPVHSDTWPQTWKTSYSFDKEEVFGQITNWNYYYSYCNRRDAALRMICKDLKRGARIMDVAAGQGNFSIALAEMGYDVFWNDRREDLVDYVKLKDQTNKITYLPGNIFDFPENGCYDAVLVTEIIEHVAHPDQFLEKISSFVRPGGAVVITTPNGAHYKNTLPKFSDTEDPSIYESLQFKPDGDGHIFLMHPEEIATLARKCGLVLDSLRLLNTPLASGRFEHLFKLESIPPSCVRIAERAVGFLPQSLKKKICMTIAARLVKPS